MGSMLETVKNEIVDRYPFRKMSKFRGQYVQYLHTYLPGRSLHITVHLYFQTLCM
jgi:hypothetical protein